MKAAAYARYSTDRQTDNSIAAQLDAIITYCQKNNISIAKTYVEISTSSLIQCGYALKSVIYI